MVTAYNPAGAKTYTLQSSIGSTDTTIILSSFLEPVTATPYTMALLNTSIVYATIAPKTTSSEFISFTAITQNADGTATLTGVVRGLAKKYPFTTDSTYKVAHSGQSQFILSDAPQVFKKYGTLANDEDITGYWTGLPPVSAYGLVTRDYMLALINGGAITNAQVNVSGTAGETFAAGAPVYLKVSDGRWWKLLGNDSQMASVQNVQIGIAISAGTAAASIASGVAILGQVTNLSGLTANSLYYISDTGTLATTPGTYSIPVGIATSTSALFFYPKNANIPTPNEKAAMGTITVAPSTSNKFLTQNELGASAPLTIPLGESFTGATTPQPASIINDLTQPKIDYANVGASSTQNVFGWNTTYTRKKAIRIVVQTTCTSASIVAMLAKQGAPADNCYLTVETDSASAPSGTPISNGTSNTVSGASLQTYLAQQAFTFASAFTLTAGTPYWVVFNRDGANSDTNYYYIAGAQYNSNGGSAGGTNVDYASFKGMSMTTGGSWGTANNILPYIEIVPTSTGSFTAWQSDADASVDVMRNYQGLVVTTGSAGASGTMYLSGIIPGFTGLIPKADYYVSTTKGAISATSSGQFVGNAVSATQVRIPATKTGKPIFYGSIASASGSGIQLAVVKMPSDGYMMVGSNAAGVAAMAVADQTDMTTGLSTYGITTTATANIPICKGQYFKGTNTSGAPILLFIPIFTS